MALEEIERLKEKIEKDPNSKLFVPLAEEYKKAGMFDEAIDVLIKGLERQPSYLSARVSLGKIYIERGMLPEAKAEFEKVIAAIPDNLFAHKKLADIYTELGDRENAAREFKTVLRLNPLDEWAATGLAEIGQESEPVKEPAAEQTMEIPPTEPEPVRTGMEEPFEATSLEETDELTPPPPELFSELGKQAHSETTSHTVNDLWEKQPETGPETVEEIKETEEVSLSDDDIQLWKSHAESVKEQEPVTEAVELTEEESISFEDIFKKPEPLVSKKVTVSEAMKAPQKPAPSTSEADACIQRGKYLEAFTIYKNLLTINPGNPHILQRIEELRSLLKLLGKDKEQLIVRLEAFLKGIKKRKNEFFRSS